MIERNLFTPEHDMWRESVRRFIEKEIVPYHDQWEKDGIVPRDLWLKAGEAGMLCCTVPEEYGGLGLDYLFDVVVFEELWRVGASGPGFLIHTDLVATYILSFGTDEQKRHWLPKMVKDDRALAFAYVDSSTVQDRLDAVLGTFNWKDDYTIDAGGSVVCRLTIRDHDGEWITKTDIGSPSEQPDEHDRTKAAFSDALKRAAVKFGVGRYLRRLVPQWADYDKVKKQITKPPSLPFFALPNLDRCAGPQLAAKMSELAEKVATMTGGSTGAVVDDAIKKYDRPRETWLLEYPRREVLDMMDRLTTYLAKLDGERREAKKKGQPDPSRKPAPVQA